MKTLAGSRLSIDLQGFKPQRGSPANIVEKYKLKTPQRRENQSNRFGIVNTLIKRDKNRQRLDISRKPVDAVKTYTADNVVDVNGTGIADTSAVTQTFSDGSPSDIFAGSIYDWQTEPQNESSSTLWIFIAIVVFILFGK